MRYVLLLLAVGALTLAGTAVAGKPDMLRVAVDNSETIHCGTYDLTHTIDGFVIFRDFFREGELAGSVNTYGVHETFTGPGGSLSTPNVGIDHFRVQKDGSATLAILGLVSRFVVPGQGIVFGEVGQLRFYFSDPSDTQPDVVLEAGHHDGNAVAAACDLLAPS